MDAGKGMGTPDDPNPLDSIEAEQKAMKKGRGRMIAAMVAAVVLAVGALGLSMAFGGESPYAKFGKRINGLDQRYYDGFWACTLQGYDLKRLRSDQDVRNQLHERGERGRARFGAYVRDQCLPKLAELEPQLQAMIPPEGMAAPVRSLSDAVARLRGGFSDYIAYLDGLQKDEAYDRDQASDQVGRIAKAWYDYGVAFAGLNKQIKQKLQQ